MHIERSRQYVAILIKIKLRRIMIDNLSPISCMTIEELYTFQAGRPEASKVMKSSLTVLGLLPFLLA